MPSCPPLVACREHSGQIPALIQSKLIMVRTTRSILISWVQMSKRKFPFNMKTGWNVYLVISLNTPWTTPFISGTLDSVHCQSHTLPISYKIRTPVRRSSYNLDSGSIERNSLEPWRWWAYALHANETSWTDEWHLLTWKKTASLWPHWVHWTSLVRCKVGSAVTSLRIIVCSSTEWCTSFR